VKEEKMQILYTIKGIRPYDRINGFVAVLLSPVDNLQENGIDKDKERVKVSAVGPCGEMVPQEVLEQIQGLFQQMTGTGKKGKNSDRNIVLIESEIMFQKRGWHYGDTVTATFEKIQ